MEKLKLHSPDFTQENIMKLAQLFPNCVTEKQIVKDGIPQTFEDGPKKGLPKVETAIDFDQLRQELSTAIVDGPQERYQLNWPGKREALLTANAPIAKTLRPVRSESVDFDTTQNLFIEGDNLDALKLLQETYLNKVKMIYIDPPYNTGNDFIYEDDFAEDAEAYFQRSNQKDEAGRRLVANTEANGRFHSDWLSMMYPRLKLARNLLSDKGVALVSIGDRELNNLISLMSEIYGEKSQVGIFTWKSRAKPTNAGDAKYRTQRVAEYVVAYGKCSADELLLNAVAAKERAYPHEDKDGKYRTTTILTSNRGMFKRETMRFEAGGFKPDENYRWKAGKVIIENLMNSNRISFNEEGVPVEKKYEHEEHEPLYPIYSFVDSDISGTAEHGKVDLNEIVGNQHGLDTVKPVQFVKYLISTFSSSEDVILDFFAGSGTTGQAVIELNSEQNSSRRFILNQIPEIIDGNSFSTIAELSKERIRRAGQKIKSENALTAPDLDTGFRVLKIDSSNMKDVYYAPDAVQQGDLLDQVNNIWEDRTPEDLLFQVLLDWGVDLALPITQETIAGKSVFFVAGNALAACFDTGINETFVKELAARKPLRAVFRDAGFSSDSVKINVEQIFKLISPSTEVKSI
jgi:adenine-specific DNA-methyltransferase